MLEEEKGEEEETEQITSYSRGNTRLKKTDFAEDEPQPKIR